MKLIRQITLLLALAFVGELLNKLFNIPIPGSIIGMILLLIGLIKGWIKLEQIDIVSKFLLDHLAVLFVPAGVGLLAVTGILKDTWHILLIIAILTTIIVMTSTGIIIDLLRRWSQ